MRGVREKTPGALRARGFSLTGPRTPLLRHTFLMVGKNTSTNYPVLEIENKNRCLHFCGLSQFYGSFLKHLIYMPGYFLMLPINRSGYGFTDLLNDLENDFFVPYLRGLHGLNSSRHFITSFIIYKLLQTKSREKRRGETGIDK